MDCMTLIGWATLYRLLPQPLRDAIERTVEELFKRVTWAVGGGFAERALGSVEARRARKYLARAVALTLRRYPDLQAVAVVQHFVQPPVSDCLLQILTRPEAALDPGQVRQAFQETFYDLDGLGIDPVDLLREIQGRFARQLRADPKTRSLLQAAKVERVAAKVERVESQVDRIAEDVAALLDDRQRFEARRARVGSLLTVEQFFAPWLRRDRLFSHAWPIVGRRELLDQLAAFVDANSQQLAIVPGRGGIGKTRLLLAAAEQIAAAHPEIVIRVAAEASSIAPDDLADLPDGRILLLIDDAQKRDDVELVLSIARRLPQPVQVIIATRPYGAGRVRASASRAGVDPREILVLPELKELSYEDRVALAREVLGQNYAHLAEDLAQVTLDSPLLTVVGGRLLAEERVPPGLLAQHDEFRETVLARMAEEYVDAVADVLERTKARNTLELIAAIGPVDLGDERLIERAARFLGIRPDELRRAMAAMVEAGILLRQGSAVRITPDVLADYLYTAAAIPGGHPTGYTDEIVRTFLEYNPRNVLVNLAELDWRVRLTGPNEIDLLEAAWVLVEDSFRVAGHYGRVEILKMLQGIAVLQPARVLKIVRLALAQPEPGSAESQDDVAYLFRYVWSAEDVIKQIPPLLQQIAYHPEYRAVALDLLWQLGRDNVPDQNRDANHPIRILAQLAS